MVEKTLWCRHSRTEVFEDTAGGGYFAECLICGAVGECKKKPSQAKRALKPVKSKRPSTQGGQRPGQGRKRMLPKGETRFIGINMLQCHLEKVDVFLTKHNEKHPDAKIKGRSAAIRLILDQLQA